MLFNEPKLLKSGSADGSSTSPPCFSALQRAEIAEIHLQRQVNRVPLGFSALQRAEIAEIDCRALIEAKCAEKFQCSSTSRNC